MIDLNVRFAGSLSKDDLIYLAKEQKRELEEDFEEQLCALDKCQNAEDYRRFFELPLSLLQTVEGIEYAMYSLTHRLAQNGYLYAEIGIAPYEHTQKHLTQERILLAALRGLDKGMKEHPGFNANLIVLLCREVEDKINDITMDTVIRIKEGTHIVGIGLTGYNKDRDTKSFQKYFETAKAHRLPIVFHAEENKSSQEVIDAVELGATRVSNAVYLNVDPAMAFFLSSRFVTLELCPSENIDKRLVQDYESCPIRNYTYRGVNAVISSGAQTVSYNDVSKEFICMLNHQQFTREEIYRYLSNAVNASFLQLLEKGQLFPRLIALYPNYFKSLI